MLQVDCLPLKIILCGKSTGKSTDKSTGGSVANYVVDS